MAGLLVHEWIEKSGGAERVLDAMAQAFPDAGIRSLWDDTRGERYPGRALDETWLARTPLRRHKALALPFAVPTWRRLSAAQDAEWMLISSHLFAHHARIPGRDVPKFVYAHTPARYIWNPELDERGDSRAVKAVAPLFRRIDRARAQEATAIAANSAFVRDRIRRAWDRDAEVIHPPVAVDRILSTDDWRTEVTAAAELRLLDTLPEVFVLGASRFVRYKSLDRVIQAGEQAGVPVVIAGRGPDEARLRAAASDAGVPVTFAISPSGCPVVRPHAARPCFRVPRRRRLRHHACRSPSDRHARGHRTRRRTTRVVRRWNQWRGRGVDRRNRSCARDLVCD